MSSDKTQARFADTRQKILDSARGIILGKGYAAVGLNEILSNAGVPKGSFYHYFKSKDDFGRVLLEEYFSEYLIKIESCLGNRELPAVQRLLNYFEHWLDSQCSDCQEEKCVVVKLSAEVTDLSEQMRQTLQQGIQKVQARLTQCIAEAIDADELKLQQQPEELAHELYYMWLGATLVGKVNRTPDALQFCMRTTRQRLSANAIH